MVVINCGFPGCTYETPDVGEQLACAALNSHSHAHSATQQISRSKAERAKRPLITSGMNMQEWDTFLRSWAVYKKRAELATDETTLELILSCDDDLKQNLFRAYSQIENSSEEEALTAIKKHAVKTESFVVAQVAHVRMRQSRGESIRQFEARLQGQASICQYQTEVTCKCGETNKADFTDIVTRFIIAANIEDMDVQRDLLSRLNCSEKQMSAEEVINFIEAREKAKESVTKLSNMHANTNAALSSFKKLPKQQSPSKGPGRIIPKKNVTNSEKCSYCDTSGHGNHTGIGSTKIRKTLGCPAFGKQCNKCNKFNHYSKVCRMQQTAASIEEQEEVHFVGGAIALED